MNLRPRNAFGRVEDKTLGDEGGDEETMEEAAILIVDDTRSSLLLLKFYLEKWGYAPLTASSGPEALKVLDENKIDLIISDQVMPGMDGIEFLRTVKNTIEDVPFIMLTAYGSIDKAVISIKQGADDYITKPYKPDELKVAVERSLTYYQLTKEHKELQDYLRELRGFKNLITKSDAMLEAIELAVKVAETPNTTVAIYGESGVGKEVLSRAIHSASGCMESRFIGVNCAGIPSSLLESELFGHVKGAYTGADSDRDGKLSVARKGTLLLDEIGDMPLELQAKLLRVLQERTYEKVGSDKKIKLNTRIITTTHRDVKQMVADGDFREDLFHRINLFPITLPPLRERMDDIPILVDYFMDEFRKQLGKPLPGVSKPALDMLSSYHWPGNVRELKNSIERAAILNNGELIQPSHLSLSKSRDIFVDDDGEDDDTIRINMAFPIEDFSLDTATSHILETILKKCGNNKARAAKVLGVDRKIFYRRK